MNTSTSRRRPSLFTIALPILLGLLHAGSAWAAIHSAAGGVSVLELEGKPIAVLKSFSGGGSTADVVSQTSAMDCCFPNKRLSSAHGADMVLTVGGVPGVELAKWIQDNLGGESWGRDGSIVILDANYKETRRINFTRGRLMEIGLPTLAANSTEPFAMTLRIGTETSQIGKAGGQSYPVAALGAKAAMSRNFKIDIPGVDTRRVSMVEAITLKRKVTSEGVGEARDLYGLAARFEVSDLVLSLANINTAGIEAWHQDFVVNGNNDDSREREGNLYLMSQDLKTALLTISLRHLGIRGLSYEYNGGMDTATPLRARMYLEGVSIKSGGN